MKFWTVRIVNIHDENFPVISQNRGVVQKIPDELIRFGRFFIISHSDFFQLN